MKNIVAIIIIAVILLIWYNTNVDFFMGKRMVKSSIDGRQYLLTTGYNLNPSLYTRSADVLAYMNNFIVGVLRYIRETYIRGRKIPNWSPYENIADVFAFLNRLIDKYNPDVLQENVPTSTENTSYVIRKGETIAFCIKKKGGALNDDKDTLQFVALHELTHIGTLEYGHPHQFWLNFKLVLLLANESKLYTAVDYDKHSENYCGLDITYNPMFDDSLRSLI